MLRWGTEADIEVQMSTVISKYGDTFIDSVYESLSENQGSPG